MICCCVSDRNFLDYPDERGVIAFLNGVDLEESLFSSGLLVAKIVGVTFACGSSLAVGPEGPMIHIGATIGTVQKKGETCQPYQNALRFHCLHCMTVKLVENKDHLLASRGVLICKCLEQIKCLDDIHPSRGGSRSIQLHAAAVGAGCGVAAAFEAPIAGAA